jgi:predicted metalloprotease with PDZ domain
MRQPLPVPLLAALSLSFTAFPVAAPAQVKVDTMNVTLTPEIEKGVLTALRIDTDFIGDADGETIFALPQAPGGSNSKAWEKVADLKATGAELSGSAPEERILKHAPSAPIRVSYRIHQAKASNQPFETIVQPHYFSSPGWEIFSGLRDRRPTVHFRWGSMPAGWVAASDLEHAGSEGLRFMDFRMSTLMGGSDVVVEERSVGKGRLRVAMLRNAGVEPKSFVDLVGRLAQTSNSVWQDSGSDFFITLTTIQREGQAGLGMGDGYALYLPRNPDQFELRNTLAHEHLHSWIGRRFGGGKAWFREGFAEYYSRLVNLRAGSYSLVDYTRRWNEALLRYASSPLRLKTDAEADSRFFSGNAAQRLGEDRGSMMAALLNYRLRKASSGKVDLTDVLLKVKEEFGAGAGEGDGPARLVRKAREMTGADLQGDIDRHLGRGEELLFPKDLFGSCGSLATITIPKFDSGYANGSVGDPVEGVDPASRAYAAGMRDGMILVKREGGTMGNSRAELVWRVKDGDQERVIRYQPVGKGTAKVQELRLRPGLAGPAEAACIAEMTGSS